MDPFAFWSTITPLLPFLGRAEPNNTIGVRDGTLYDILDDNNGIGNVTVGAKSFNATCGYLPNTHARNVTTIAGKQVWNIISSYNNFVFQDIIDGQGKKIIILAIHYSTNKLAAPNVLGPMVFRLDNSPFDLTNNIQVRKH